MRDLGRTGTLLGVTPGLSIQNREDFLIGGEAPQPVLREDQLAFTPDLERPTTTGYQLDFRIAVARFQLLRQPGGAWLVVSKDAVFDAYAHVTSSAGRLVPTNSS